MNNPSEENQDILSSNDLEFDENEEDSVTSQDSLNQSFDIENNIGIAMYPTEEEENCFFVDEITTDEMDEFVTSADTVDHNEEDIITDNIPTTDFGEYAYTIEDDSPKGSNINGHVILNQCGSILTRKDSTIER